MSEDIKPVRELVENVRTRIETLDVQEALRCLGDPDCVFVDLRDSAEIKASGTIPNAIHMPRGNLEFWIDPSSPYYKPIFGSGRRFVFFCAADLRSTLAVGTAQSMGLDRVCHIGGGFNAWQAAGGPTASEPRNATEA